MMRLLHRRDQTLHHLLRHGSSESWIERDGRRDTRDGPRVLVVKVRSKVRKAGTEPLGLEDVDEPAAREAPAPELGESEVPDRQRQVPWPLNAHDERVARNQRGAARDRRGRSVTSEAPTG